MLESSWLALQTGVDCWSLSITSYCYTENKATQPSFLLLLLLLLQLLHQHPLEVQTSELLPFAAPTGKSCTVHLWQEVNTLTPLAPLLLVRSGFSRMASISSLFRSHRRCTTPATPVSNSPFAGGNPCKTWLQLSYVPHLLYSSYNLNLILCLLNRGDVCCAGNAHRK